MIVVDLEQGTPEWDAHRAHHHNASEAPAMLGLSPYKTRAQLVREHATGITAEIDDATQRRFDDGHRFEALARPLAEQLIGEDLFPCVGVLEGTRYSASFDGLTMLCDTAFEHKSLNDAIRNAIEGSTGNAACLPEYLRVQMEQQCMVSGAERVLFMASKWNADTLVEERHCWYYPDAALRARIEAGWAQFDADVADYQPDVEVLPPAAGAPVEGFGSLTLRVEGRVLASNLDGFRAGAEAFLARLPKPENLHTDQDFADADLAVKACAEAESRIKTAKDSALAQMSDVETVMRTADSVGESIRQARLALEKLVTKRKDQVKAEIVTNAAAAVRAHFDTINATLGAHAFQPAQSLTIDLGAAIKGKRTLSSMRDAIDSAVAREKIEASQRAERVRACIAIIEQHAEHRHLFADAVQLCATKQPDDLRNLVAARVAEHQKREADRIEAERERIRKEEADRLEREQRARDAQAERDRISAEKPAPTPEPAQPAPAPVVVQQAANTQPARVAPADSGARIALGDICARIAPLTITAAGLAQLGFQPVATERSAKLYAASDFRHICDALHGVVSAAAAQAQAA